MSDITTIGIDLAKNVLRNPCAAMYGHGCHGPDTPQGVTAPQRSTPTHSI